MFKRLKEKFNIKYAVILLALYLPVGVIFAVMLTFGVGIPFAKTLFIWPVLILGYFLAIAAAGVYVLSESGEEEQNEEDNEDKNK